MLLNLSVEGVRVQDQQMGQFLRSYIYKLCFQFQDKGCINIITAIIIMSKQRQHIQVLSTKQSRPSLPFTQEEPKVSSAKDQALPKQIEQELELNLGRCAPPIQAEIAYIFMDLLKYPSNELAEKHRKANKLGCSDIYSSSKQVTNESVVSMEHEHKRDHCEDCGLLVQEQDIPVCTAFHKFPKVGIAAYLLFENLKSIILMVLVLGAIYSSYALYINITEPSQVLGLGNYAIKLSYASQLLHTNTNPSLFSTMEKEGWLVVTTVVVWWVVLWIVKTYTIKYERMVDDETITAADFSVMIQNLPIDCTQEQLQGHFDRYYRQICEHQSAKKRNKKLSPFVIEKISKAIPFHLVEDDSFEENLSASQDRLKQMKQLFVMWIDQIKQNGAFTVSKGQRQKQYQRYVGLKAEIKQKIQCRAKKMRQLYDLSDQSIRTTVFVSFKASQSSNTIIEMNPQNFSHRIRYVLSCCQNALYFQIDDHRQESLNVVVSKAPEPEDVIWQNIGVSSTSIVMRKLLTYFILLLLLGGSFGIVYGLTILQMSDSSNQILSIAISISITAINILIGIVIRKLTLYQRDFTVTKHQISLSIKSIAAQLMNSILVPVITNIYIEKNIYGVNGLVYDVLFLAATNALLPPLLKILDGEYFVLRVLAWWNQRPYSRLTLSQKMLNAYCEERVYELGVAYVYFVNMFYFTCFYVTMHPSIVIFTIIGFVCMYWAEKYSLLCRSKRPTPSSSLLEAAMGQLISFGPCVISMGSLTWYNLLPSNDSDFGNVSYLSRLVLVGLSLLFFIFPFNSVLDAVCHVPEDEILDYQTSRMQLTSEYDRLNPATMEEGIADYLTYLKNNQKQQHDDVNRMMQLLVKKSKHKTSVSQVPVAPKRKQSQTTAKSINKQINVSSNDLMIESMENESEQDKQYEQSTEKMVIRNDSPSKRVVRRRMQQDETKPKKKVMFDDLKGYNQSYIKSNTPPFDPKNPYSHLKF